jgi:hypothetical protein
LFVSLLQYFAISGEFTMMIRMTHTGLLLLTLVLAGCLDSAPAPPKEDLVPVSGKVTVGGKPVEGVTVAYVPSGATQGQGASGVTDSEGQYKLVHNATKKEGVAVGDYTVQLSKWVLPDGSPLPKDKAPHMAGAVNMISPRWAEFSKANEVKVPAGGTTKDFDVPAT